jgi:hypothetical protein
LPEPELPDPEAPEPLLPAPGLLLEGELLDGEGVELAPPALPLPVAPPLLLPSSFMHLSRSAPVRPTHLLLAAPEGPDAPVDPEAPLELLPDVPGDAPVAPEDEEPPVCAMETLASAKSAAAVAVPITFSICLSPSQGGWVLRRETCNMHAERTKKRRAARDPVGPASSGGSTAYFEEPLLPVLPLEPLLEPEPMPLLPGLVVPPGLVVLLLDPPEELPPLELEPDLK